MSDVASADTWINKFLFWDLLFVGAFWLLDKWLGERNRTRLLRRCRLMFFHLRRHNYVTIYQRHVENASKALDGIFGRPLSRGFFLRPLALCGILVIPALMLVSLWRRTYDQDFIHRYVEHGYTWLYTLRTALYNVIAVDITFMISLVVAQIVLRKSHILLPANKGDVARRGPKVILRTFLLVVILLIVFIISVILSTIFLYLAVNLSAYFPEDRVSFSVAFWRILGSPRYWIFGDTEAPHYFVTTSFFQILAISPALIHLFMTLAFLLGKLANFVVSYIVAVTFLRVSESKAGAIAQIGVAGGAAAKLVEVWVKAF